MNSIGVMKILCGFKIKRKADCEMFINECMQKDNTYMLDISREQRFFLDKDKQGNVSISEKRGDLNDMFNPLIEVASQTNNGYNVTVEDVIWQLRKYINKKWFS